MGHIILYYIIILWTKTTQIPIFKYKNTITTIAFKTKTLTTTIHMCVYYNTNHCYNYNNDQHTRVQALDSTGSRPKHRFV